MFLPHPRVKVSIVGSLRDREVACSASDRQGSNFESCVWRTVPSQSSHHPQEVLLAQFSLCVHKGGLKPDSFHFICQRLVLAEVPQSPGRPRWLICIDWGLLSELPGSSPGRAGYLSSWLCIYSAQNCSKAWSVQCCLWYRAL